MKKEIVRIGTRGSKLALYQANKVKDTIELLFENKVAEIVIIKTKGDKILDTALSKIGDKGLFTKELENSLINNEIDLAVHSLKDLSTELPENLKLGAVLKRGEFRDAFVHKNNKKLSEITDKDIIATSSLRRKAGMLNINKNLNIIDIRGNVNTRIQRMEEGYCDGMVMAAAGLIRLGLESYITEIIDPAILMPAVGQGAIAIESRINDEKTDLLVSKLNHKDTMTAVLSERAYMNTLQGGCQVPVGCYTTIRNNKLEIHGFIASENGEKYITDSLEGPAPDAIRIGEKLASILLEKGGLDILTNIRKLNNAK